MTDLDNTLADAWANLVGQPAARSDGRCVTGDFGHAWQRASHELSLTGPSTKDQNFACGRAACGARRVDRWNGDRWMTTVYPVGVAVPVKLRPQQGPKALTDEERGAAAAENGRARTAPPSVDAEKWLAGYDAQQRRMEKPWGRPANPDPRAEDAKVVDPIVQAVRDRTRELVTPQR